MEKITEAILYRDDRYYCAFPTVAMSPEGKIIVAYRRACDHRWLTRVDNNDSGETDLDSVDHLDPRSHTAMVTVSAGLEVTSEPTALPFDPQAADQDPSLLALRSGRLLLAGFGWYPVTAGRAEALRASGVGLVGSLERSGAYYIFWGGYTRRSDDGGRSWTAHAPLPVPPGMPDLVPGRRPWHGGAVRGRAVELTDGTILQAAYCPKGGGGREMSILQASEDNGQTWTCRGVIAEDTNAGFVEPALQVAADGRLFAFHRSFGLDDRLVTAVSRDEGRSWGQWTVHDVIGHPYDVCALPDGRLLMVYGYRHAPYGVRGRVWDSSRQGPEEAEEFIIRDDSPSPDVGYPWACVTPEGKVLVVYYMCDSRGIRHIAGTLLDPA